MRYIIMLALLLTATTLRAEPVSEDVFESANHWTVQVRTAVDRPFIEDEQGSSLGAGMVIDAARGWVLTNAHVASRSYSEMTVTFRGQKPLPAERLYVDPYLDLAVIAYDPQALRSPPPQPQLECDSLPAVGHPVGAFGHPWGFRFTGTRGIASAVTSRLGPTMLQTDAPINHGNSGGPLISLETGRVVGINAAIIRKDLAEGLNFAVPMPYACTIIELLKQGRDPSPPVDLVDFALDSDDEQTLLIAHSRLPRGSVDLRPGDVVRAVGASTTSVDSQSDLVDALRGRLDQVTLHIERNGQEATVRGHWPAAPHITERKALWIAGALFAESEVLTAGKLASELQLMVHHVESGSVADASAISQLDMLVSADGTPVDSLATLQRVAEQAAADDRALQLLFLQLTSHDQDKLFVYASRTLEPGEIQAVGPTTVEMAAVQQAGRE